MFKHDADFNWRLKRKYVKAQQMQGFVTAASIGDGASVFEEMAASGVVGLDMPADADMHHDFFPLPYDLDVEKPIWFRVLWSMADGTVAAADDTNWTITYTSVNAGYMSATAQTSVAGTTTLITSTTALDKTINTAAGGVQDYETTTEDTVLWTAYGYIAPKGLDPLNDCLAIRIEMTAATGSQTNVFLMGYEMAYSPRYLQGPDGMRQQWGAPVSRQILSNTLTNDSPV